MRLYSNKISSITEDALDALQKAELIEIDPEDLPEVVLDFESVMKEYLRVDKALTDEAKDEATKRGLEYGAYQKIKRDLAEKRHFGLYEDAVGYLCTQLIETLLHTQHVQEVYGEDHELRAVLAPILKHHMSSGDGLDQEVRKRIKNLQEGTQDWEIRYQQELARVRSARQLEN